MKFRNLFLACFSIGLLAVASCKKEDEKATAGKVLGKWGLETALARIHLDGEDESETYDGQPGDYFDFNSNGTVTISLDEEANTYDYALQNDSKMIIEDFGSFDIQALTDNTLKLFMKKEIPDEPGDYIELTFDLKK